MSYAGIIASSRVRRQAETIMHLSYTATTSLNLRIQTASGDDWEIDWGDGVWERYVSSTSYRTKTFGSATAGVARVRSATGRGLSDLHRVQSTAGTWSFDVADLCATYHVLFQGNSMALTGDVGDIKATNYARFQGISMTLTGDVGDIKATNEARFQGNSMTLTGDVGTIKADSSAWFRGDLMTLTGDVGDIKATNYAHFYGDSMELTYTTTTWTTIPTNTFLLNLATGHLTTSELSQMLVDMDASGITGTATLDFRHNNGAPNAAGITAANNLLAKGYTVLTN